MELEWIVYHTYSLRAPSGFLEWVKNNDCGCGPGKFGNRIVPNSILGISIKEACCIHDMMYRMCNNENEKILADLELFGNGVRIINQKSKNKFTSFLRAIIISWYFLAVFYGGGSAFKA